MTRTVEAEASAALPRGAIVGLRPCLWTSRYLIAIPAGPALDDRIGITLQAMRFGRRAPVVVAGRVWLNELLAFGQGGCSGLDGRIPPGTPLNLYGKHLGIWLGKGFVDLQPTGRVAQGNRELINLDPGKKQDYPLLVDGYVL